MKIKYSQVKPGQTFKYGDIEFTKLNDMSIIDTIDGNISDCCFDNFDADYEKSLIRYYINNRYCELMCIDKEVLLPINDLGDKLQLLSVEEFYQFGEHIKPIEKAYWLRSPDPPWSDFALRCNGTCSGGFVFGGNIVRPTLIFKPDVIVEVEDVK